MLVMVLELILAQAIDLFLCCFFPIPLADFVYICFQKAAASLVHIASFFQYV